MKKLQLFDQHHGLSPLQKCQFCLLFKYMFILSKNACFVWERDQILFLGVFCIKRNVHKINIFDQHHGLTPLEKRQFCEFLNRRFRCSERLVCYIKGRKSFFLDLFSGSMTREYRGYRGLQGVTKGDRVWQGVTWGYKGLQGVTKGYKGLQGVTTGDKGLQKVTKN